MVVRLLFQILISLKLPKLILESDTKDSSHKQLAKFYTKAYILIFIKFYSMKWYILELGQVSLSLCTTALAYPLLFYMDLCYLMLQFIDVPSSARIYHAVTILFVRWLLQVSFKIWCEDLVSFIIAYFFSKNYSYYKNILQFTMKSINFVAMYHK